MRLASILLQIPLFLVLLALGTTSSHAVVEPLQTVSDCDRGDAWEGGTLDTTVQHSGLGSIRWEHGASEQLHLRETPTDWTAGNALRFYVHNTVPGNATFMLIVRSENPDTPGMDYWMHRVKLDFEGWKPIVLRRQSMNSARRPLGWDKVDSLMLTASGWEQTVDPAVVVHIDQLEIANMVGPRVTDAELFEALDLSRPDLSAVRDSVATGDLDAACARLADYYRQRTEVGWFFDPHSIDRSVSYSEEHAQRTLEGTFRVINIDHTFPEGEIDWFYNPTVARDDLAANREWQWQLGRMNYWPNLGRAYWATGDERYARAFVSHLRSWARHCPRPESSGNTGNSAWRTIECGIRMGGSWPDAFMRFLHSPSFTDADICLFLTLCYEHALHLMEHRTGGNWLTMEMSGLFTIGALFPEFEEAGTWRSSAAQALYSEMDTQFLPDGAQVELTTGYHQVALGNVLKIPRVAEVTGTLDELPDGYVQRTEKAFDYNLKLMTPDRGLPTFNDAWKTNVPRSLRHALQLFPQREDFRWVVTDGEEGSPPEFQSILLPYAGYAAMRSGWERDANYLAFDGGLLGYAHVHQDKLNVVMWSHGREVLYDGGGGSYESSKWRDYAIDTFAHNTVLVDGQAQQRDRRNREAQVAKAPLPITWHSGELFDYAAADYSEGYGSEDKRPATHSRRVLFIKPSLVIVADILSPNDEASHTYQARWHLRSTETERIEGHQGVTTADPGQPNLAVIPLLADGLDTKAVSAQEDPEVLGWEVLKNAGRRPSTTVCHSVSGTGVNVMATLLVPLREAQSVPVVSVAQEGPREATARFSDGTSLQIAVTDDGISATLSDDHGKVRQVIRAR